MSDVFLTMHGIDVIDNPIISIILFAAIIGIYYIVRNNKS